MDGRHRRPRFICHPDGQVEDASREAKAPALNPHHPAREPGFFEMTPGRRQLLLGGAAALSFVAYLVRRAFRGARDFHKRNDGAR
jgi:hypothetical protein